MKPQSHFLPTRSQSTSLGSHSVWIVDSSLVTFFEPHFGQGGAGFVELERYSSKRCSQSPHRYS